MIGIYLAYQWIQCERKPSVPSVVESKDKYTARQPGSEFSIEKMLTKARSPQRCACYWPQLNASK